MYVVRCPCNIFNKCKNRIITSTYVSKYILLLPYAIGGSNDFSMFFFININSINIPLQLVHLSMKYKYIAAKSLTYFYEFVTRANTLSSLVSHLLEIEVQAAFGKN